MMLDSLLNVPSALIVVGGTLLGTALRCGPGELRVTFVALGGVLGRRFSAAQARADLAAQVNDIRRNGLLRANPRRSGDAEIDDSTDALISRRSVPALIERHKTHRARRVARADIAVGTLAQAAELAPVFGLAGTLVSLSQLPSGGIARGALTGTISMAVLTTLYGLLLANLLFAPLARLVERVAADEDAQRQDLVDWLTAQVEPICHPGSGPVVTQPSARSPSLVPDMAA
jgi:chemotaxis protein MotA